MSAAGSYRAHHVGTWARVIACAAAALLIQAAVLRAMGQPLACGCGRWVLWYGAAAGPQTSQQLTDPYSLTHVEHGLIFWLLLRWVAPRAPARLLFLVALGIEGAWEIIENTPFVIERYRRTALAAGYVGDSIFNSLGDTLSMVFGFTLASRVPARYVVAALVLVEALLALVIRDNLALNVVQIFYPIDAVQHWQSGR